MKAFLKEAYKEYLSKMFDGLGVYDSRINNQLHKFIVPMYHRVITDAADDPYKLGMCVTDDCFEQQVIYLKENFSSISLFDYHEKRVGLEKTDQSYVSLTFDDGYKDNLITALPILNKHNMDATIFICTKIFTDKDNYWWDGIINCSKASRSLSVDLTDLDIQKVNGALDFAKNKELSVRHLLRSIWESGVYKDESKLKEIKLRILDGQEEPLIGHLTEAEVKSISEQGVTIDAHTLTHPDLTSLSPKDAQYEIEKSKSILSDLLGKETVGFAYPAGFKNDEVIEIVKKSGFSYAVSTDSGVNYKYKPHAIERIGMPQTNISDLKRCISAYSKIH